jgi:hypothetical protein
MYRSINEPNTFVMHSPQNGINTAMYSGENQRLSSYSAGNLSDLCKMTARIVQI